MDHFSFDHLSETEFEQFGYDLLVALGFSAVSWRKGTGLATSPADSGRDLECQLVQKRIDDEPSNPTKDCLEKYIAKNNPPYKIIVWERPKLEKLTATHSQLLRKYRLSGDYPFLALLHPSHIACLQEMPMNTLEYFLGCLDELPPRERNDIFGNAYYFLIQPQFREAVTGKETMAELQIDRVDYAAFKQRCYQVVQSGMVSELVLTSWIVTFTLNHPFKVGDTASIDERVADMARAAKFFQSQIEKRPEDKDLLEKMVTDTKHRQEEMPARIKENYSLYCYFCEHVLEKLRLEKYLWKYEPPAGQEQEFENAVQFYKKELENKEEA